MCQALSDSLPTDFNSYNSLMRSVLLSSSLSSVYRGKKGGIKSLSNLSMTIGLEIGSVTLNSNITLPLPIEASFTPFQLLPSLLDSANDKGRSSNLY